MAFEVTPIENSADLTRQPVSLALLFALAIAFFVFVTALSRIYHSQQHVLAVSSCDRGVADLNAGRYSAAVNEFRTALRYSPGNFDYELSLAEALLELKRADEAFEYLDSLRERQPDNGQVNLLLGRIAAASHKTDEALRFYHNAMYATWPSDQELRRRDTRIELIEYLLNADSKAQAQSELISLAASLNDQPNQQTRLGQLFLQAQDYERALAAFRLSMKSAHHNHADVAGAGVAAFELGRYPLAKQYLQAAVAADVHDEKSSAMLRITELVLQMDPFQRQISSTQRGKIVIQAFTVAGARLTSCSAEHDAPAPSSFQALVDKWTKIKPEITEHRLQKDPDLVEAAMELVFNIEHQTSSWCAAPTESDTALLLIARLHEGS
ncbi:MAG TPA: tetratricopeptide repeat protein [Candidatus Saccharimonadales bacterium]|nr:tetratricopeptide repeat protein [Candidatus Saccharimonadales bacterium]